MSVGSVNIDKSYPAKREHTLNPLLSPPESLFEHIWEGGGDFIETGGLIWEEAYLYSI